MGYKLVEGTLMLNMSFNFSRKLRDEIEESFNWQAVLLIIMAIGFLSMNVYMLVMLWAIYAKTGDSWILIFTLISIGLGLFMITYTVWLGSLDCVITNAACLSMFCTYCIYRYAMRSVEPECAIHNFTIANMLGNFFGSIMI